MCSAHCNLVAIGAVLCASASAKCNATSFSPFEPVRINNITIRNVFEQGNVGKVATDTGAHLTFSRLVKVPGVVKLYFIVVFSFACTHFSIDNSLTGGSNRLQANSPSFP